MKTVKQLMLVVLLILPVSMWAQPPGGGRPKQGQGREMNEKEREEKIDKLKIAFITDELDLTSEEAEKFWPIYNELEDKLKELRKANRKIQKEIDESYETLSNEDAKKKLETILENDKKEIDLRKEYSEKFSKVIGDKRTLKLLSLEHEFKRELLERLKEQGPPPPPPGR